MPRISRITVCTLASTDRRENIYFVIWLNNSLHFALHVLSLPPVDKEFHVALKTIFAIQQLRTQSGVKFHHFLYHFLRGHWTVVNFNRFLSHNGA